jgi:diguanylate cyclase (GGDEF)-like protein
VRVAQIVQIPHKYRAGSTPFETHRMRVPTASTAALFGLAAGCFGVVVMAGWLMHAPTVLQLGLGQRVVPFDGGVGLALAGFGWAWQVSAEKTGWRAWAIGGALILLGAAGLAEIALDRDLGIDLPTLHRWYMTASPHPGRLSAPTWLWFGLFGGFLLLFEARGNRAAALCLEPVAFLLLLISVVGVIGNWLSIEDLYRWRESPRMSLATALGLSVVSASAWMGLRGDSRVQQLYATREEWILTILAAEILIMMAFVGGLGGFAALQHSMETQLSESLRLNLTNRAQSFETIILGGVQTDGVLASRAPLVRSVATLDAGPDAEATAALESSARGFLLLGFRQVRYLDHAKRILAQAGDDSELPGAVLDLPDDTRLGWDGAGFVLFQRIPMLSGNAPVGWLEIAQALPALTAGYRDFGALGETADSALCDQQGERLLCFPGRGAKDVTIERAPSSEEDPIMLAFAGERGLARYVDGRRELVIAAYAPVGTLGLALVLKMDLRELYAPVRRELEHVVPLLLILVAFGTLILSSQVTPLATRLRRLATLDGLTGVLNRATYLRMSEHELQVAKRRHQPVSVVMLDADHFKQVNDSHGHDVGDEVLRLLTATCRSTLRAVDVIGRLGGEEFALTLPDTAADGAQLVAERLRARVAALQVPSRKGPLQFTVSLGIACYPGGADEIAGLLKAADEALYRAKAAGRNRIVLATEHPAEALA